MKWNTAYLHFCIYLQAFINNLIYHFFYPSHAVVRTYLSSTTWIKNCQFAFICRQKSQFTTPEETDVNMFYSFSIFILKTVNKIIKWSYQTISYISEKFFVVYISRCCVVYICRYYSLTTWKKHILLKWL